MIRRLLLLSILVAAPVGARADFVIHQKLENAKVNAEITTRIKGDKARRDTTIPAGTFGQIINLSTGGQTLLVPARKEAMKISGAHSRQMWSALKAELGAHTKPPPPKDTGRTAMVGGYKAEIYTWTNINGANMKLWVAGDFPNYKQITEQLDRLNGAIAPDITKGRTRPDPATVPGMVMKNEIFDGGTNVTTTTLISAKEEPVDASAFAIPAGYHVTDVQKQEEQAAKMQAALKVGAQFPGFGVQDVDGKPLSLAQDKGKVVLVDFWATWCPPCRAEVPNVVATYKKYHGKGFDIIGISLDQDRQKLLHFTQDHGMTWPQYFDGQGWENKLAVKYGIQAIPATFLLDGQGKIIGKDLRGDALGQAVAKAVAQP